MSEKPFLTMSQILATVEPAHLGPNPRLCALGESEIRARVAESLSVDAVPTIRKDLVLALLLLWNDHLEASHRISQNISNPGGSIVHAIMHRREPDYWNSKHWWRQAGQQEVFDAIGLRVAPFLESGNASNLASTLLWEGVWKPGAFVDICESVSDKSPDEPQVMLLRELQRIEFEVLLERFLRP